MSAETNHAFLPDDARALLQKDTPGLELLRYWKNTAETLSEPARVLLSYLVSGLIGRGWAHPIEKAMESAGETLDLKPDALKAALAELQAADLLTLDGSRIATLGGLLSTRATGAQLYIDHEHQVHLLGPFAGLAVTIALQKPGEVRVVCSHDRATKLVLVSDINGVVSRDPETVAVFLPSWDGIVSPTAAMAAGGFFADDEALGKWEEEKKDPPGMPLASFMFPMAATDLGQQLGQAMHAILNHLPDFS